VTSPAGDDGPEWERLAMDSRTALDLLGFRLPPCLFGELDGCAHTPAQHAAANLGALRTLVQDLIMRLRPEDAPAVWEGARIAGDVLHGHGAPPRPMPGDPPGPHQP
jgi:hypothetical protein